MSNKISLIISIMITVLIISGCGKKAAKNETAIVKIVSGEVTLISEKSSSKLKAGDTVRVNDRIVTGPDGVAVIEIGDGLAIAEIQNNADFKIASLSGNSSEMQADKGNIWLNVAKKLVKGDSVTLKTNTTVASVRGTKFYTFMMDDYQATCYCEGEVKLSGVDSAFSKELNKDYLSYTKNGKTIFLTPKETEFMTANGHNHSVLDKSPLGKKACEFSPEMHKKLKDMVDKKFAEAK